MRKATKKRLVATLLLIALVLVYHFVGDRVKASLGIRVEYPPRGANHFRIATWNLRNFPKEPHHLPRMETMVEQLDADILAVQEVNDLEALQKLLPNHAVHLSQQGGRGHQRLGLAVRPERVQVLEGHEHPELSMSGHVRPAFHGYVRMLPSGPDFHVVVVHLKAKADGQELRRKQWHVLAELRAQIGRERITGAVADADMIMLGDFNVAGSQKGSSAQELHELTAHMIDRVDLQLVPNLDGCSSYWDGRRRDAWKEPSLLDLVWVGGLQEAAATTAVATPTSTCARYGCSALRSTDAYPVAELHDVSDHCPVIVDLLLGQDDD